MEEIYIGMTREGMRKLAENIVAECDRDNAGEVIEVSFEAEHNGSEQSLRITFNNDDMEREPALSPDTAYWER